MNVAQALELDAEVNCTITAYVGYVSEEKEWPEKRMGDGAIAPARNSRTYKLTDDLSLREATYIWATLYFPPGASGLPRKGDYVQAKGVLKEARDPKPGEPELFMTISGKKAYLGPLPGAATAPQAGKTTAALPSAPNSQQERRRALPLDTAVSLMVGTYLKLAKEFADLSLGPQAPGPAELQALAVSVFIAINRGEVEVPAATLSALLKRSQPAAAPYGGREPGEDPDWVRGEEGS